jgi:hypothetical protein
MRYVKIAKRGIFYKRLKTNRTSTGLMTGNLARLFWIVAERRSFRRNKVVVSLEEAFVGRLIWKLPCVPVENVKFQIGC